MTASILSTKIHLPPVRCNFVSRTRLTEQLIKGWGKKVTLISAVEGYGKTTFMCEWITRNPELQLTWLLDAELVSVQGLT